MAIPFDQYERLDLIKRIVMQACPHGRILDVGGFPGTLAQIMQGRVEVVTVDRPARGGAAYVQADAINLPFADGTFDAAVASDVLEHIAPENRNPLLGEMSRVSREWIMIGGPFASPAVCHAEQTIGELSRVVQGKENEWLAEHRLRGLPVMPSLVADLRALGIASAFIPNGSLFSWLVMMGLELLLEAWPDGFRFYSDINAFFVEYLAARDFPPPTYRHLLLAHRNPDMLKALAEKIHSETGAAVYQDLESLPVEEARELEKIRAFATVLQGMLQLIHAHAGETSALVEKAYVERLERITERLGEERRSLKAELEQLQKEKEASRRKRWWK